MLDGKFVEQFIRGTVYQAFLSAENYHRWHSPVSGAVKMIHQVEGSYYAEAASEGFDPAGPNNSQGYIAHVATRVLIFIEADEPAIGLICLMPVGMGEVSSCVLSVRKGQCVKKGDEIGFFSVRRIDSLHGVPAGSHWRIRITGNPAGGKRCELDHR